MQAHVVCPIVNWGDAPTIRFEWNVNGTVVSSVELYNGYGSQLEVDVPEYSSVRLDAIVVKDGLTYTASSDTLNVGVSPTPVPDPNPTPPVPPAMPMFGSLQVAYWF